MNLYKKAYSELHEIRTYLECLRDDETTDDKSVKNAIEYQIYCAKNYQSFMSWEESTTRERKSFIKRAEALLTRGEKPPVKQNDRLKKLSESKNTSIRGSQKENLKR